jgi:Protein kinase domain
VVTVIDHAGDEDGLYIVMELVHGTDLGAQLKLRGNPGLPVQEAIEYARHACEALQYVHDQQIVHRVAAMAILSALAYLIRMLRQAQGQEPSPTGRSRRRRGTTCR